MSKKIFCLWLAICCCSCVVSREKYAASLRDAELTRGRLTDQRRAASREQEQLNAQLAQLRQERDEAEARAKRAEQSASQSGPEVALLGARIEALESLLGVWRAAVYGQLPAEHSGATFASSSLLFQQDPSTQKTNFLTTKAGLSLSPEATAQLKALAAQLQQNNQSVWLLGFAEGTTDDLKTSSEYSLLVARALISAGLANGRLRVSYFGATQPLCQDAPVNGKREARCLNQNNRVQLVLLTEGF